MDQRLVEWSAHVMVDYWAEWMAALLANYEVVWKDACWETQWVTMVLVWVGMKGTWTADLLEWKAVPTVAPLVDSLEMIEVDLRVVDLVDEMVD
jgi:hypothetical protein